MLKCNKFGFTFFEKELMSLKGDWYISQTSSGHLFHMTDQLFLPLEKKKQPSLKISLYFFLIDG